MKCYNLSCKEECDELKKMYCIFKITEQQKILIAKINKGHCQKCLTKTILGMYNETIVRLCTNCGRAWKDREVVRACLVNSRRAG